MIVLGLDTTGADCSACLIDGQTVLSHTSERIGRGHAERLAPMVVEQLKTANLTSDQIDRIAVCTGPGSFTGLRVALSFAKGFALPRRTPVLGFNALHVEAARRLEAGETGPFTIYRDVKRGQVFAASVSASGVISDHVVTTLEAAQSMDGSLFEAESCDVTVLARLAQDTNPSDHSAQPLYARAPDAKLPGGVTPSA